jgi:hypothetical protein
MSQSLELPLLKAFCKSAFTKQSQVGCGQIGFLIAWLLSLFIDRFVGCQFDNLVI